MDASTRSTLTSNIDRLVQMDQCSDEYDKLAADIWVSMDPGHRDVLGQLVNEGPTEDGNIASKAHRNDLMDWGLASRACVKGQQGFAVANYRGWDVFKAGVKQARFNKET